MTIKQIKNVPSVVQVDQSTLRALEDDNHNLKQLVDLLDEKITLLDKKQDIVYGLVKAVTDLTHELAKDAIGKGSSHDGE